MKKIELIFLIFASSLSFSQSDEKEIVYLIFDKENTEQCLIEDGSGNSRYLPKYIKEYTQQGLFFKICHESFVFNRKEKKIDTCSVKALANIKFSSIEYINDKKAKNPLRYNPFEKIYIIEKISNEKILKYEVVWIDDWIMVED